MTERERESTSQSWQSRRKACVELRGCLQQPFAHPKEVRACWRHKLQYSCKTESYVLILKYSSFLCWCSMCLPCVCHPAHVVLVLPRHNHWSGHARGMCHWLLSAVANLAQNCGSCRALSSFTWFMLSKRCSTLRLIPLAAVCKGTMYYIAGKKQPSLKTLQKVDGCWEELWRRSSVSRQRGSTWAACCAQPVVLGKSSRSHRFC